MIFVVTEYDRKLGLFLQKLIIINIPRVTKPNIIVVPMLKKVDETIDGIIKKNEKGLCIPPVK